VANGTLLPGELRVSRHIYAFRISVHCEDCNWEEKQMIDMDKVIAAMNAGDAPKISPSIARARKKAADAAKKAEAAKKPTAKVVPMKKPEAKKAAASKKAVKTVSKAPVKKAAASKKVARKTMKAGKKKR
jgi:hypothetical protein